MCLYGFTLLLNNVDLDAVGKDWWGRCADGEEREALRKNQTLSKTYGSSFRVTRDVEEARSPKLLQ